MKDISAVAPVKKMIAGETGISQFYSPAAKADMIAGFTTVPSTGWGIMIPQPMRELEAKASTARTFALITIFAGLIIAASLSWVIGEFISRLIARPVRSVAAAARSIAAGDRQVRVPEIRQPRELSDLASSFNEMAITLEEVEAELRRSEGRVTEVLGEVIQSIEDGAAIYDTDDRLVHFNEPYTRYFSRVLDILKPGISFREIFEAQAERGIYDGPESGYASLGRWPGKTF